MLDVMFELPDQEKGGAFVINDDVVHGREKLFKMAEPRKSA